jgi:hypothetical protein
MALPSTAEPCIPLKDIMLMMISRIGEIAQTLQQDEVDCFISELMAGRTDFCGGELGGQDLLRNPFAMRLYASGIYIICGW